MAETRWEKDGKEYCVIREPGSKTVKVIVIDPGKSYKFGVYSSNGKITEAQIEDSFKIQTNTL